jgi:hypothetical protein
MRELEIEVHRQDAPYHPTVVDRGSSNKPVRSFKQDLIRAAKFSGLFVTGAVIVYISQWLAWISLFAFLGAAGWLWYKYRVRK